MNSTNKTLALAVGSALMLSIGTAAFAAGENPFATKSLASGYQVADAGTKTKDGKCGAGKCGAEKAATGTEKSADGKCGAGKCGADKAKSADKATDGKCGAGKCGAEMKSKESK